MEHSWKSTGTPHQLEVNNVLETISSRIAKLMNEFFIEKVKNIRDKMVKIPENVSQCILKCKLICLLDVRPMDSTFILVFFNANKT